MELKSKAILSVLGLAIFSVIIIGLMLWLFPESFKNQFEAINSGRQVIVLNQSNGYAPGAIISFVALFFFAVTSMFFLLKNEQDKAKKQRFVKFVTVAVLVGLASIFVGQYLISSYLKSKISGRGYQPCPATTLLFTRVTYSAWTLNPALCFDADVKRIVQRGVWDESKQVEQMLQQRERQQEARRQFLLQEEKIKQQRAQRAAEAEQN
ncbi:hypothetical protein [Rheinheimera baltica]|uniref:hypothetical protein n=1 Tax=Rheinheimera baltica TaxID=67576 RepID=UPI00273D0C4C|nr:hypothetical protein [Rheinheimera baltica]MDP5192135.1 hypothetical protein [Rheinheimera baltica]